MCLPGGGGDMADNGKDEFDKFMMYSEKTAQLMSRTLKELMPKLYEDLKERLQDVKELTGKTWDIVTDQEARSALIEARHEAFNAGFSVFDKMDNATKKEFCDSLDSLSKFNKDTWQVDLTTLKALAERAKDIRSIQLNPDQKVNPDLIKGVLKTRDYALHPDPISKAHMLSSIKKATFPIQKTAEAFGKATPVIGGIGERIR